MKGKPAGRQVVSELDPRSVAWVAAAFGFAAAPHFFRLPLWTTLLCLALVLGCLYAHKRGQPMASRPLLLALALASVAGVYASYGTIFGRAGGVAFLILLIALKLAEAQSLRDAALVACLSYFVLITGFLYDQSLASALHMLLAVAVITAALAGLYTPSSAGERLRLASVLMAQALPLMLVLFVLFPRVPGPLWGMPQDSPAGVTGLSDTMAPGSLSALGLSDAVAFRVDFKTPVPKSVEMYWRGPVLWDFDGRTWSAGGPYRVQTLRFEATGTPTDYTVTLEPHNRSWLFALDLPGERPPQSVVTADYQVLYRTPVKNRLRYDMRSYLHYRTSPEILPWELKQGLQLPENSNPRARALAQAWKKEFRDPAKIVQAALAYFRREPFYYTLRPPLLGENSVDDFLFVTRRGFCEHYASSFAFLMRSAGIPARVVTGYQGGQINPVGHYLIVRQADAHAWDEVWLAGRGWVRIDPTTAVSPARVEMGIAEAAAGDPLPTLVRPDSGWLRKLAFTWDAAANAWNQWVLDYGPRRQREFLSRAGMDTPRWQEMAAALFVGTGILLLAFAVGMLGRLKAQRPDPVQRGYLHFCRKLADRGLPRHPWEGPRDYCARVAQSRPDLAPKVSAISAAYIALRYGKQGGKEAISRFLREVRAFKP